MKIVLISTDESRVGMGVRTLSACLRERRIETVIVFMASLDENYSTFHWEDLINICADAGLVGVSCMTHAVPKAVEIQERLSKVVAAPMLVGGIHASICPESLIDRFSYVCHGEGEDLIVEVASRLEAGESFDDVPGLWSKLDGVVRKNPQVPLRRGVNEYPIPDYDLDHQFVLDGDRLVKVRPIPLHMSIDDFVVLGSRGCPHRCAYCCNRKLKADFSWRRKVRHYSVDYLIDHLQTVKMRFPEVRSFWIEDDTFFAKSLEEIDDFAKKYRELIALPFKILISPWTFDKRKVAPLVEAGMDKLMMGVQSGCERVNADLYERDMGNDRLMKIIMSLNEFPDLLKCYDFIGMNPFERLDDLVETLNFIKKIPRPFYLFCNNLAFYPGTRLYEMALEAGLDISLRNKHSESQVGYRVIIHERLKHKLFHLLLLLMSGLATNTRYGSVPRFLVSTPLINFYSLLDRHLPRLNDGLAVAVAYVRLRCHWKNLVKKSFSPGTIARVRHFLSRLRGEAA